VRQPGGAVAAARTASAQTGETACGQDIRHPLSYAAGCSSAASPSGSPARASSPRSDLDLHLRVLGLQHPHAAAGAEYHRGGHAEAIREESSTLRHSCSAHWPTTPTTRTTGSCGQFAL
jgi:hypothetical protein